MTEGKNFRGQATPAIIDIEYRNCNFSMFNCIDDGGVKKGVRLFPGDDTPRTFIGCTMVNCEPPPGSTVIGGNKAIIERDVIDSVEDIVEIAGVIISGTQLKDVCYGKYENGAYLYFPTPKEILHKRVI